ncbi:hypothetical protein B0T20DRAFT_49641 [Sordaria brevicollis]|uniref:Uncharacterized protein n=1 Tax=Sordaria brevicollis TaxID=83679 RepID=A0AAE0U9J6_SORBR|nr:hypothetical protein B0T20DRAFT_49641 [Sordaria brevicollis]
MDQQHSSGHVTMPRDFRYAVALDSEGPKTPINLFPEDVDFPQIPSPPKPRFKVKRRTPSGQLAASQQFLASVAAADLAIPSIEEPESDPEDFTMRPFSPEPYQDSLSLQIPRARAYSDAGPKTPVPTTMELPRSTPCRYPDWTVGSTSSFESTPEDDDYISRPSTSQSTQTSGSFPSQWSHLSEEDDSDDYDLESADGKDTSHSFDHAELLDFDEPTETLQPLDTPPRETSTKTKTRKKAPWTKPMNDHLWSYYSLYLQDPKVTPFRMGKNCIPPEGVCSRVAREAIRTWRGSKASQKSAEGVGTFMRWPHTQAATRAQLRELCRQKAAAAAKNHRFLSRSVTPMQQQQSFQTPRAERPFATSDMSMSLTLSTSEHMQPQGPLAQLTRSSLSIFEALAPPLEPIPIPQRQSDQMEEPERGRLGSPLFGPQPIPGGEAEDPDSTPQPRSYGPSSSASLAAAIGAITTRRRGQTISHSLPGQNTRPATGRLQSPVRLSRSTAPGKRRNTHSQGGDYRKKSAPAPGADTGVTADTRPTTDEGTATATRGRRSTEFSSTIGHRFDELFIPRSTSTGTSMTSGVPPVQPSEPLGLGLPSSISMPSILGLTPLHLTQPQSQPTQLEAPSVQPPARLGSPLSFTSFPASRHIRRPGHGQSVDLGMLGRGPSSMNTNQGPISSARRSHERNSNEHQGSRPQPPSRTSTGGSTSTTASGSGSGSGSRSGNSSSGSETTHRGGRMADLRQRLREFSRRRGESGRRRSGSPF